jgi:hypothetical protein
MKERSKKGNLAYPIRVLVVTHTTLLECDVMRVFVFMGQLDENSRAECVENGQQEDHARRHIERVRLGAGLECFD